MEPDRVVFNALITACGQSGAVDRAFDVLAEMRAETQPIDPDHITVGALIKACTNAGQVMLVCLFFFSFFFFSFRNYCSTFFSIIMHLVSVFLLSCWWSVLVNSILDLLG